MRPSLIQVSVRNPEKDSWDDVDWRFDSLSGSHFHSRVICVTSVDGVNTLVVDVIGQLSRDVIGRLSVKVLLWPKSQFSFFFGFQNNVN